MGIQWRAHLAMFTVAAIYGLNYFITKYVVPTYIEPFGAILIRVLFGTILLTVVHQFMIREKIDRKDVKKFIICGFFGVTLNQLMFFKGLSITTEVNGSLIMTTTPILVLIISSIILKERITWVKILGIILGATGAILLVAGKDFSFNSDTFWGDLFIFINALSYGIYLILVKPLMKKYQAMTVMRWAFTFGFVMIVPFGIWDIIDFQWIHMPGTAYLAMGYIIVFTTFFAYVLNAWSLRYVNASVVGFYVYLQPLLTTLLTLMLGRDIDLIRTAILSILIFTGVYLVSK